MSENVAGSGEVAGSGNGPGTSGSGSGGARDLEIEPDKIEAVAGIVEEQAAALRRKLDEQTPALTVLPPSEDIVSVHVAEAWNTLITEGNGCYVERVRAYEAGLVELAARLRLASREYAENEQDNAAAVHGAGGN
ncbi:PE domain-containing protein [Saccharomonospora iraqiensis]|uniref:PE domain-containing protein n=1 Tax=Saccharomonospora iraqiensis TaxID=52698 RepID=UPI00022E20AF|nr:PE domain-containing protein [Saccharomonospora iraqiensis]